MELVDTHCHIHFEDFLDPEEVLQAAADAGVSKMISVGVSLADSEKAVKFANAHENIWATVGTHPHDGADYLDDPQATEKLSKLSKNSKVVAIGEIGLDYYHSLTPKDKQIKTLRSQIEVGLELGFPFVFHVREAMPTGRQAWDDFWRVFDSYKGLRGVVHSFSAHPKQLEQALTRDLYVGLNGIMTFTKDPLQLEAAKQVPTNKLLLETDAPFLAPKPFRGVTCEPKHVVQTAKFLAELRGESLEKLAATSTKNAQQLFDLKEVL